MPKKQARVTYQGFLQIEKLLSLQRRLSPHHDEWQFIIVHQAFELWFKLILIELRQAIQYLTNHDSWLASKSLRRINAILRTMIPQTHILETMNAYDFGEFRPYLGSASGFDSDQFRAVVHLSGLPREGESPKQAGATLHSAWLHHLTLIGSDPVDAILELYRRANNYAGQAAVLHLIEDYEELFAMWRNEHALLAERMIGVPTHGTGGSGGVAYLQQATKHRFFPELNQARARLMGASSYPATSSHPPHASSHS